MEREKLQAMLTELQTELDQTKPEDREKRAALTNLVTNLETILDREEDDLGPHFDSLSDELRTSIQQFEVSHPALTAALSHMLDTLSQAGI